MWESKQTAPRESPNQNDEDGGRKSHVFGSQNRFLGYFHISFFIFYFGILDLCRTGTDTVVFDIRRIRFFSVIIYLTFGNK